MPSLWSRLLNRGGQRPTTTSYSSENVTLPPISGDRPAGDRLAGVSSTPMHESPEEAEFRRQTEVAMAMSASEAAVKERRAASRRSAPSSTSSSTHPTTVHVQPAASRSSTSSVGDHEANRSSARLPRDMRGVRTQSQLKGHMLACRYFVSMCLDFLETPSDGFYDVWGEFPEAGEGARLPSLKKLKALTPSSSAVGLREVVFVTWDDILLEEMCKYVKEWRTTEMSLRVEQRAKWLAEMVAKRLGGAVPRGGDAEREHVRRWQQTTMQMQQQRRSHVAALGELTVGLARHRAVLFKTLAEHAQVTCRLVRGKYYCGAEDLAGIVLRDS
ncbi:hypothetical protein CYMTET_6212, partial [Cymbomonas tetramitiformis]